MTNYLKHREINILQGAEAGDAFVHFILMELTAYLGLHELDIPIQYWRSKNGLEVDFVLQDGDIAIEVKIGAAPNAADLKGLRAFCQDYGPKHAIVVCQAAHKRLLEIDNGVKIQILPWQLFLENLWSGEYINAS
jgi:predicted AAA+ superfamily ATPase